MSIKIVIFFSLICVMQVMAAPKPINWSQLGRNALDFGRKAAPVVKNGCQLLNGAPPPPQIYYVNVPYQNPQGGIPIQYAPPVSNNIEELD
ncbi:uncharacterized protein LOC123008318 [Tribolium madens]|uniref:uncharacterized protein LOC123008318 n=1 Tax=Tribolium madens TaxID=41895 RepID=UPI001CF728F7|nr:uncharacterized protein LOC123008318 [Tribolium madens]